MQIKNLRSTGLLAVGAIALLSMVSTACSTLKRLEDEIGAVNILLDAQSPFAAGTGGSAAQTFNGTGAIANLISISGSLTSPSASPVPNAAVTLTVGTGAPITMASSSAGVYAAVSGSGGTPAFTYASNQTYTISMTVPSGKFSGTYTTRINAPRATQVTGLPDSLALPPTFQPAGQPLTLNITSGPYDYVLAFVVDSTGNVTYTSEPQTPQQWLNFVLGSFNSTVTIPGTAFPNPGVPYAVAVAGMNSAPESGISTNLEILTHFLAGSAKTAIVITSGGTGAFRP